MLKPIDELTTKADSFYTELEDNGSIHNMDGLQHFLDNLVDFLENQGGKVEGIQYEHVYLCNECHAIHEDKTTTCDHCPSESIRMVNRNDLGL